MLMRVDLGPAVPAARVVPPPAAGALSPGARPRQVWGEPQVEHSTRTGFDPTIAMMRWFNTSLHFVHQLSTSPPAFSGLLMPPNIYHDARGDARTQSGGLRAAALLVVTSNVHLGLHLG